jgi:hypothetical protein
VTRAEAIAALVAQDVARWGEGERAASQRLHQRRSRGQALNTLAARAELAGADNWRELRAEADSALTDSDRRELREGG